MPDTGVVRETVHIRVAAVNSVPLFPVGGDGPSANICMVAAVWQAVKSYRAGGGWFWRSRCQFQIPPTRQPKLYRKGCTVRNSYPQNPQKPHTVTKTGDGELQTRKKRANTRQKTTMRQKNPDATPSTTPQSTASPAPTPASAAQQPTGVAFSPPILRSCRWWGIGVRVLNIG